MNMQPPLLSRREAIKELLQNRGDLLVVSGLGSPTYDVFAAGDHDANFYLWGAMGSCALVGLGLALAQPSQPVAAITGDGEQLMGVGGLLTIAVRKPTNLTIVVLDNGHFGETGMQRSHSSYGVNLTKIAADAGFKWVSEISRMSDIPDARAKLHDTSAGPALLRVQIETEELPRTLPPRDGVFLKTRFRQQLGLPVA